MGFAKAITTKINAKENNIFANIEKVCTFAPDFERNDGVVAQLVEQRTENPCVTGSIPVDATKVGKFLTSLFLDL